MSVWEFIQVFGSMVGLATGIFVLFDRVTREWPVFILESQNANSKEHGNRLVLRVHNKGLRPVEVRVRNQERGVRFIVMQDDSTISGIRVKTEELTELLVNGDTIMSFPVVPPSKIDFLHGDDYVPLYLEWRFAQPAFLMPWRKRRIGIFKGAYKKMHYIW